MNGRDIFAFKGVRKDEMPGGTEFIQDIWDVNTRVGAGCSVALVVKALGWTGVVLR